MYVSILMAMYIHTFRRIPNGTIQMAKWQMSKLLVKLAARSSSLPRRGGNSGATRCLICLPGAYLSYALAFADRYLISQRSVGFVAPLFSF